jgi:hypothetical protein
MAAAQSGRFRRWVLLARLPLQVSAQDEYWILAEQDRD